MASTADVLLVPIPQQHAGDEVTTYMAASLVMRDSSLEV